MWQLVQAELRYQSLIYLPLYAALALGFAIMPGARLAYVLLLVPVVLGSIVMFKRNARQKWERRTMLLPIPPIAVFRARLSSVLIIAVGAIVLVGVVMLRDVYASLHPVLLWRLLSLFNIVAMAMIAVHTLADVRPEHEDRWQRYIYPGILQFFWIMLYSMFIDSGPIARTYELLLPASFASDRNLIYETPYGVAALAFLNLILFGINWLIFRKRTTFTCK